MNSLRRFFREHLLRFVPTILSGSLLLFLAAACQGLLLSLLELVFEQNLKMGVAKVPGLMQQWRQALLDMLPLQAMRESLFAPPILMFAVFFIKGLLGYSGTLFMVRSGLRATQGLRERLFSKILDQEPAFFQRHSVGELLTRNLSDVGAVQGIASNQFAEAVREIAMTLAMVSFIFIKDWKLSLSMIIFLPLVILPLRALSRRIRSINHRNQEASARLLQRMKEVFSNIRIVLGFAREGYENQRFHVQNNDLYRLGMKNARAAAISAPIMELVGGFLLAVLMIYGSWQIREGHLSGSAFFTYLLGVYAFYDPLRRLIKLNNEIQVASASLDRIYSILDLQPSIQGPSNPVPVPTSPQILRFEGVSFSYGDEVKGGKSEVLKGIDLEVKRGETVALVGGSGGGKTTLINLVPRFFDPTQGCLTLDGIDLREMDPRELRRRIGMVTQETLLFMDSIHDNIAYGQPASRSQVEEAARRAFAHDFILKLPKGYDTPLAETGSSLSGGQRQRIAIARALLQDPPILILDEATSALDSESEQAVQAALEALMQERTTLVIAHRLSTIQRATRICVLKKGRIIEMGSHEELLALGGEYARLKGIQQ